ncbi:MAG TPA: hypothetical protein PKD34_02440 [Candidatus Doudnabacteria bacterium]|nr:hypothetical protein [Candidatus Doudnabacteria bacterium]
MQKTLKSFLSHVVVFALSLGLFVPVVSSQKRQVRTEILEGVLGIEVVEESEVAPSHHLYYIEEEDDGKNRVTTYLSGKVNFEALFNKKVVLRGHRSGGTPIFDRFGSIERMHQDRFHVEAVEKVEENDSLNAPNTIFGPLTLPPSTGGDRKMITINIAPANNPTPQYSVEWLRGLLYTNLDSLGAMIYANSYGQTRITGIHHPQGDIAAWVTVPFNPVPAPNGTCNEFFNAARIEADNLVEAQGFSKTEYWTRNYMFRNMPECLGLASASVGPFGDSSGIRRIFSHMNQFFTEGGIGERGGLQSVQHELGHNLGQIAHSKGEQSEGGMVYEYGDRADPMGGVSAAKWLMFGNHIRLKLGWHASTARYVVIDTRGSQPVHRFIQTPAIPTKGIGPNSPPIGYIIPIRNTDGSLTNEVYIVERRRNHGFFEQFATNAQDLGRGLIIRKHSTDFVSGTSGSVMLNPQPQFTCCTRAVVPFGGSYTTSMNITFTVGYGTPNSMPFVVTLPDYYPASIQEAELTYREYHRDKLPK